MSDLRYVKDMLRGAVIKTLTVVDEATRQTEVQFSVPLSRIGEPVAGLANVHLLFDERGDFVGVEATHV